MEILNDMPMVLTKDKAFVDAYKSRIHPGAVILLPDDAVLVSLPQIVGVEITPVIPEMMRAPMGEKRTRSGEITPAAIETMLEDMIVNGKKPAALAAEYGIPVIKIYNLKSNFKRDNPDKIAGWEAKRDKKGGDARAKVLGAHKNLGNDSLMICRATGLPQKEVEEQLAWLKHEGKI